MFAQLQILTNVTRLASVITAHVTTSMAITFAIVTQDILDQTVHKVQTCTLKFT